MIRWHGIRPEALLTWYFCCLDRHHLFIDLRKQFLELGRVEADHMTLAQAVLSLVIPNPGGLNKAMFFSVP